MDLEVFSLKVSIWAIPTLFAVTVHEVAHGWTARLLGDRTAELLGRLSPNPFRHIDPVGTVAVPSVLLALGLPLIGWAKPVPVVVGALAHPRLATICVALAGPAANLLMAAGWCGVLGAVARVNGNATLIHWVALMAQAGIVINVVLALFNLLPVPPLDGGRVLAAALPPGLGARVGRFEPLGLFVVVGLSVLRGLDWLFEPAFRLIGRVITVLIGSAA